MKVHGEGNLTITVVTGTASCLINYMLVVRETLEGDTSVSCDESGGRVTNLVAVASVACEICLLA